MSYIYEDKLDYNFFTEYEVKEIIKKLQKSDSPGFDRISFDLLVQIVEYIMKQLLI